MDQIKSVSVYRVSFRIKWAMFPCIHIAPIFVYKKECRVTTDREGRVVPLDWYCIDVAIFNNEGISTINEVVRMWLLDFESTDQFKLDSYVIEELKVLVQTTISSRMPGMK